VSLLTALPFVFVLCGVVLYAVLAGAEMIFAIDPVELKRTSAPTFRLRLRHSPPPMGSSL